MVRRFLSLFLSLIVLIQVMGCSGPPSEDRIGLPTETPDPLAFPFSLISTNRIFSALEDLTAIRPYSGWHNSATEGEAEALDYMAHALDDLTYLQNLGLELERQTFHVFLATEIREARLFLTRQGTETEVPANAPRGHRNDTALALNFDSDGSLNDLEENPVETSGKVLVISTVEDLDALQDSELEGGIVFLDYALIDPETTEPGSGSQILVKIAGKDIAGLVLVTEYTGSTISHGKYLGDGLALENVASRLAPAVLYVRLEDLSSAGISDWDGLAQIESARLIWDSDVLSPGMSGNLVAHIPGADSSRAVILGAHIDSANSPGASDNGVNSTVLLEVARVLNEAQIQPPVDLYLVWFGSEELGLYGSQYFVNTHQELLDRTIAALLMDSIIESLPGPFLTLDGWSYSRFGSSQLTFPDYLANKASSRGISIDEVSDNQLIASDNGVFNGFVTQAGFAFGSPEGGCAHSPYDDMEAVRGWGDLVEQVAKVAMSAALDTGRDLPELGVTPASEAHALIVGSHTEVPQMTGTTMIELDHALTWEGFDVDTIAYGQALTSADLIDVGIVIVLPVIDYPGSGSDEMLYDEAWSAGEIEALVSYVEEGGLLVLTNSANRIQLFGREWDANEDWEDTNALSKEFGVLYQKGVLSASLALSAEEHSLMENVSSMISTENNGVPFTMQSGLTLAEADGRPVVGLVKYGSAGGEIVVLADEGILGFAGFKPLYQGNFQFLRNLAQYARSR
jgi:hypothetical protein